MEAPIKTISGRYHRATRDIKCTYYKVVTSVIMNTVCKILHNSMTVL